MQPESEVVAAAQQLALGRYVMTITPAVRVAAVGKVRVGLALMMVLGVVSGAAAVAGWGGGVAVFGALGAVLFGLGTAGTWARSGTRQELHFFQHGLVVRGRGDRSAVFRWDDTRLTLRRTPLYDAYGRQIHTHYRARLTRPGGASVVIRDSDFDETRATAGTARAWSSALEEAIVAARRSAEGG